MAADPKLRAFITAVTFADGSVRLGAMTAPDEASLMLLTGVDAGRQFPEKAFAGYAYAEMSAEYLRGVLRSIEAGKPSGEVVSLVSDNPKPTPVPTQAEQDEALRPLAEHIGRAQEAMFTPVLDAARRLLSGEGHPTGEAHGVTLAGPPIAEAARRHPENFCWGEGSPVPQSAWGLTNTIGRCETHPHAPLLNGRCPICQPTGGVA